MLATRTCLPCASCNVQGQRVGNGMNGMFSQYSNLPTKYTVPRVSAPANQFTCNSCWAISVCQAVSDRYRLKGVPEFQNDELNYYTFHDCISNHTDEADNCMTGADVLTGMNEMTNYGAHLMSQTKDRSFDDECIASDELAPTYKTKGWRRLTNPDDIKKELVTNGSVVATMNIYPSFDKFVGASAYIPDMGERADDSFIHMISIVGYDDVDHTWLVRNSYGESFGNKGFIKIKQQDPRMEIEQNCYAPII